jgi:hypothetical protein
MVFGDRYPTVIKGTAVAMVVSNIATIDLY